MIGFDVDIFEAKEKPSGLTVYGVAPYKITNEEALDEMSYLENQFGYKVHYGKKISTKEDFTGLEKKYDAIFIGIGLGTTSAVKIKGEELENVFGATEFIEKLRMSHHKISVPKKVIVLGGGNTAMDAASESARMGAEKVILAYRRSKEEILSHISFRVNRAEIISILGPSGVGKTTLLRCIAGLLRPTPRPGQRAFKRLKLRPVPVRIQFRSDNWIPSYP